MCISTIQRMYSILKGEELDESAEETSFNEMTTAERQTAKEVVYNAKYPPEFFDCIIIDECHRSIYNVWQQVLDYFDAFLVGLTATPDKRTFAFFEENVVSEYSREQAIIDGVNVGEDIFLIETQVTQSGAHIMKQLIECRNRLSREKRWKQLDEDVNYVPTQLDRDIVNPSQIRMVIRTFRENLFTTLFPRRKEVPKTLIFAKTDSHADDIIQIVRKEFGEGNEFCQKITYAADNPEQILSDFRNNYNPRIAVTVDMIATGTDVKPIECLIFMRDVRSKNYFEQMKGRGTRVLGKDDLQKVTPSATENKDHFVIVDAVGVTKSKKSETRTLERKPSVSMKELMLNVALGARDADTLTSLANRVIRLNSQMSPRERKEFAQVVGLPANQLAENHPVQLTLQVQFSGLIRGRCCRKPELFRRYDQAVEQIQHLPLHARCRWPPAEAAEELLRVRFGSCRLFCASLFQCFLQGFSINDRRIAALSRIAAVFQNSGDHVFVP